jgi:hypothetical protein
MCFSVAGVVVAGSTTGAGVYNKVCPAFGETVIHEQYWGNQAATLLLIGDGDTDLDIFVYDQFGRLVVCGTGPTDRELVTWTPPVTGNYKIVIRNLGGVYNRFQVRTN